MSPTRLLCALGLSMLVAACDQGEGVESVYPLRQGTVVTLKAFGRHYDSKAVRVEGGYSSWATKWGDKPVSRHKEYRGIVVISGREGGAGFYNEFDVDHIDQLFPLKVGAETSFSGVNHNEKTDAQQPFWTHILVRKQDSLELRSGERPVYIIDITTETKTDHGIERTERVIWYSPELGISLKSEYRRGEEYFQMRALEVKPPSGTVDPSDPSRRSLGTVMI